MSILAEMILRHLELFITSPKNIFLKPQEIGKDSQLFSNNGLEVIGFYTFVQTVTHKLLST